MCTDCFKTWRGRLLCAVSRADPHGQTARITLLWYRGVDQDWHREVFRHMLQNKWNLLLLLGVTSSKLVEKCFIEL